MEMKKVNKEFALYIVLVVAASLLLVNTIDSCGAQAATKEISISTKKPDGGVKAADGAASEARKELAAILAGVNSLFRKQVTTATSDMTFEVYYATKRLDQAAVVVNTVPASNGQPASKFATLFMRNEDGRWYVIPDNFEL